MVHISKSKTGFIVVLISDTNGKVLSCSEVLSSKQNCWINVKAQLIEFCGVIFVQDNAAKKPQVYSISYAGNNLIVKKKSNATPSKPYIPNSKK